MTTHDLDMPVEPNILNGHRSETSAIARAIVDDLLSPEPTYQYNMQEAGKYSQQISAVIGIRQAIGREAAKRTIDDLKGYNQEFRDLLEQPVSSSVSSEENYPKLPPHVKANQAGARSASPILDAMIAFFRLWATRSYEGYHEAVAIWVLSTIAARRVVLKWRNGVWTPFYIMIVSKSGRHAKTEAASYGVKIIRECGLGFLLVPDETSPQRLLSKMAGKTIPRNYSVMTKEEW